MFIKEILESKRMCIETIQNLWNLYCDFFEIGKKILRETEMKNSKVKKEKI